MTKLRKLTALLLAGALTLLLLTACSGGGGSSGPEAQAEAKVMRAKNATLTLVAKYDYNDTTLQKIIDQIKGNDQNEALDFALNGNYTKAGVVARTIRGQTYVAISLRVGRNL